jgi:hypothetical protein
MILHEDQLAPIEAMKSLRFGKLLELRGGAGSGKSSVIKEIRKQIPNVLLACPTGQAASIIGGLTIHNLFGIPTGRIINPDFENHPIHRQRYHDKSTRFFGKKRAEPLLYASWIILDEYFMIRCDHMDFIDYALRKVRSNMGEPFGGIGVLLVGDDGQLGSVVPGMDHEGNIKPGSDMDQLLKLGYNAPFGANQSRILNEEN